MHLKISFRRQYAMFFARAFDVYLEMQHRIDAKLDGTTGMSKLNKLQSICPCCQPKVSGEKS